MINVGRNKTIIPKAPLGRILMNSGAKRVSQSALDAFCEIMEDIAKDIGTQANKIAKHAGRKTIHGDDIKLAAKQG